MCGAPDAWADSTCRFAIPAGSEESVRALVDDLVPTHEPGAVRSIAIDKEAIRVDVSLEGEQCQVLARHPSCAEDGDVVGEAVACAVRCERDEAPERGLLERRCAAVAATTIPWKALNAPAPEPTAGDAAGADDEEEDGALESVGTWYWFWLVRVAGLPLLLLPLLLVWPGRRRLPAVPRSHLRMLAGVLALAAVWRFLLPVPGFFREANVGRDLIGASPDLVAIGLYQALTAAGIHVRPEQVLFGLHAFLGWCLIPAAYVVTLALVRRSSLALWTAAFVAFHPLHAKFGASEALTTTTTYVFAGLLLTMVWWTERRSVVALVVGAALTPLLLVAREEGIYQAGLALLLVAAWARWRHGWRVTARLSAFALLAGAFLLATRDATLTTSPTVVEYADEGLGGILPDALRAVWVFFNPVGHAFLDPTLVPLPFILLFVVGALRRHRGALGAPHLAAVVLFCLMFVPYGLVTTNVEPLGEGRYQSMLLLPGAWIMALGTVHATRWLRARRDGLGPGPLRRLLDGRVAVAAVAINLACLVPVLRVQDYDMPQRHEFVADLAADPVLNDARAIVMPRVGVVAGEYRVDRTSALANLLSIRLGRQVAYESPDGVAALYGHADLEGVYYVEGLICRLRPKACDPVRERLTLEPVRTHRVTGRPYAARGGYGEDIEAFEIGLYRVLAIEAREQAAARPR